MSEAASRPSVTALGWASSIVRSWPAYSRRSHEKRTSERYDRWWSSSTGPPVTTMAELVVPGAGSALYHCAELPATRLDHGRDRMSHLHEPRCRPDLPLSVILGAGAVRGMA